MTTRNDRHITLSDLWEKMYTLPEDIFWPETSSYSI